MLARRPRSVCVCVCVRLSLVSLSNVPGTLLQTVFTHMLGEGSFVAFSGGGPRNFQS
jgi:hypothetical protein